MEVWHTVFDNHMHLREDGYYLDAAREFRKSGGTAFNLVNLPDYTLPTEDYYARVYDRTVRMAERVRDEVGLKVLVTLGPYPLDYLHFTEHIEDAYHFIENGIDLAAEMIKDGKADAIGEVGRPHFETSGSTVSDSNRLLEHSMSRAAELSCPVILHTEDLSRDSYSELASMAEGNHLPLSRLVKHHAYPSDFRIDDRLVKSILATRNNVREALEQSRKFFLETDYVDDVAKPGKVIPANSVPKRAVMIRNQYDDWEEIFQSIFKDVPYSVYRNDMFL